jgi:uncharacterized Fe-S cluster-containing protein
MGVRLGGKVPEGRVRAVGATLRLIGQMCALGKDGG